MIKLGRLTIGRSERNFAVETPVLPSTSTPANYSVKAESAAEADR